MAFKTLFFPPKNKKLAQQISISSPGAFKESIADLKRGGLSTQEFRALNLAKIRARLQLRRKNLSGKERMQFKKIASMKIK